jgi:PEP-CTERM motif
MSRHSRFAMIQFRELYLVPLFLAAACVLVSGASQLHAAGLTYVDAVDDFTPASQNLFPAAGGSLSTVLDNSQSTAGDNKWGYLAAGAGGTVYESNTEDNPELRMHAAVPNGSYDVYVAYWSGGVQELIRAGLTSNPGANTNYTRAAPAVIGSAAAWSVKPDDNINGATDDNGTSATTRPANATGGATGAWTVNPDPFYDHIPASGDGGRFLYFARLNAADSPVVTTGGAGFDIFVDDGPALSGNDTTRFDGLAYVAAGTPVFLTATVNRDTGNLTINNPTTQDFSVVNYTVSSTTGSLNASTWHNITHGTTTITQAGWAITAPVTPPDPPTAVSATALTEAGTAANFANTTGTLDLGNVWRRSAIQDLVVSMQLSDGSTVRINPTYSGTALTTGDFNADGFMNKDDFIVMMTNLQKSLTGQTISQTYSQGDINQDGVINRDDFVSFRSIYCAANGGCSGSGAGSFEAIMGISGVPEPSTWLLVALGTGCIAFPRRRRQVPFLKYLLGVAAVMQDRRFATNCAALAICVLVAGFASSASALSPVTGWKRFVSVSSSDTLNIFNGDTNSPTFGNGSVANANNYTVFGQTPDVTIQPGDEVTMTGTMRINKANTTNNIPSGDVRFGIWNKANPNVGEGTGWLGYMAIIPGGTGQGALEVRNPDDTGFNTVNFLSDSGQGSIASTVGPAPTCATGMTCNPDPLTTDNANVVYAGTGRYLRLARSVANNNANFQYNQDYAFAFHVGRYGTGDYEVSATLTQTSLAGDYNTDGVVNTADYTVWRDHLGQTFDLPNRSSANTGPISQADYTTWKSSYGQRTYTWNIGGGTDYDGVIPPAAGGTFTSHLTETFNRVGLLFGGGTGADSAVLGNVEFGTDTIQTLSLNVNTTSGAASIKNTLASPLSIDYYEISSANGVLLKSGWTGIDGTATSAPDGNGWDAAGGATNNILAEGNLTSSLTLNAGASTISLGNIFNTSTIITNRDLRFFIGLTNGSVIRGNVNYGAALGAGGAVPEPGTLVLLMVGCTGLVVTRRRRDHN